MAQAPRSSDVPEVGLRNTRDVIPIPRSAALQEGVRTADAVGRVINTIADQQNEIALSRLDTETAVELDAIRERYRTDDDWQTAPQRARAEAETLLATRGESLRGAAARRVWEGRSADRLGRFELTMRAQSRERGASLARADLVKLGETSERTAGDLTQSEDTRELAVRNYAAAIESAIRNGLIDPDDGARLETIFADNVRRRVQDGLRAEIAERLDMDPDVLAEELADDAGAFVTLDPDERARLARTARSAAASMAIDAALEHTLRTGEILGENDERLAGGWDALGDGARLRYAQQAAAMAQMHRLAGEMGDLSGLSLAEIAARADDAQGSGAGGGRGAAPRAALRVIRNDPAGYVLSTQDTIRRLQQQAAQAVRAANAAPDDAEARLAAVQARRAYATATLNAQAALGLSRGQQRINSAADVDAWARRVRGLPPERQQAAIDALPQTLLRMYGDEDLAERATLEHLEAFYANPDARTAPAPDPATNAATGADVGAVRAQILRAIENGGAITDPHVQVLLARLPPRERERVEQALAGGEAAEE